MKFQTIHISETESTNRWLRERNVFEGDGAEPDMVVVADFQTAGRGCGTNSWESERGSNLLFSILLHPKGVKANQQFLISEIIALALAETIAKRVGEGVSIKWPNDIYWHDRKLCGILIEHRLSGDTIAESIIGVGLNVNQTVFVSNAPNPVSLKQITGLETDRMELLEEVMAQVVQGTQGMQSVHQCFLEWLYRREGFHRYSDKDGEFEASLSTVRPDGTLVLTDRTGRQREYAFKEVQYII